MDKTIQQYIQNDKAYFKKLFWNMKNCENKKNLSQILKNQNILQNTQMDKSMLRFMTHKQT